MNKGTRLAALLLSLMLVASGCSIVKVNKEVDDKTVLAEFTGGQITKAQAQAEYDEVQAYYDAYGYALDDPEAIAEIKAEILDYLAAEAIELNKANELGLGPDSLTEEEKTRITEEAKTEYQNTIDYYMVYFESGEEGETEQSVRQEVMDFLAEQDYSEESAIEYGMDQAWRDKLYAYATNGVTASEEQVQAAYEEMVAADQESYQEDPYNFEYAALSGSDIYWYPEGYRTVKHILLSFTDEQVEKLSEISADLEDVRYQIEELDWQAENADEDLLTGEDLDEHEGHDHTQEELEALAEPEDAEDEITMSREELAAEEARLEGELRRLQAEYAATLSDKVAEVQGKMASGADFDDLIAEYGSDVGMQEEPGKSVGYYVSAQSEMWEEAFTQAAMALNNPGDVSGQVIGSNGIHIIRYLADVTAGPVDIEKVREACTQSAAETAMSEAYDEAVATWKAEAKIKTYPDRWK